MNLRINSFFLGFTFIGLLCSKPQIIEQQSNLYNLIFLCLFFIGVLIHLYDSNKRFKNWFRIDVIFLLGYYIVFYQWLLMYYFYDIKPPYISRLWDYPDSINYSTWLCTVGIYSFFFAYSFGYKSDIPKGNILKIDEKIIGLFFLVTFLAFIVLAGKDYLTGAVYSDSNVINGDAAGIATYIQVINDAALYLWSIIFYKNWQFKIHKDKISNGLFYLYKSNKYFLLFSIIYVLVYLNAGDRGVAIKIVFINLFLYGALIKNISFYKLSLIMVFGSIVLTFIGFSRAHGFNYDDFLTSRDNGFFEATLELANSIRTLHVSTYFVPEHEGFYYGKLWLSKILSVIPFANSTYLSLTGESVINIGSAQYITYITLGVNPYMGEGTNLISDIYLNFGVLGVVVVMSIFGFSICSMQIRASMLSIPKLIILVTIMSLSLYFSRGSILDVLRPITYTYFLYVILFNMRGVIREKL